MPGPPRHRPYPPCALLLGLASCATPTTDRGDHADAQRRLAARCDALVAAAPGDWPVAVPAVLDGGPAAAGPLAQALRRRPDGAGAEAALAVLGRLGGDVARELLLERVADRTPLAPAAALALADCGADADRPVLRAVAADRLADPTLRAAVAHTLLRLGDRAEVRELVRAIALADTPAGRPLQDRLGLPHKTRWAYERYLLITALRAVANGDFGLDTDASWPMLEQAAARVDEWLQRAPR
ncbi:MAG: hypothetical protein AB7O97_00350 [Planctomycetota bacterium]